MLALVLTCLPAGSGPASRVYASSGTGLHQVGCTRSGFPGTYVLMYGGPVLLSRILMGVGLKDKTVTAAPTFDPDAGIAATQSGSDWKVSYSGTPDASWSCDMSVECGSDTYVIHLAKLNDESQPKSGTWANKENVAMTWSYRDGSLTLASQDPQETGALNMPGQTDDFGLDKSAGTEGGHAKDWIPEVPWKYWIDDITNVEIGDGVTVIGKQTFRRHSALKTVEASGDTLTQIHADAFAFWDNTGVLESVDLSVCDHLETIGAEAFRNQKKLSSLKFPNAFTWIDKSAFMNCTALGMPDASVAYCVDGKGALYNVKADGSAAKVGEESTLYWIPTAKGDDPAASTVALPYAGTEQELVNDPSLCPETGSYAIRYTLNGSAVSGTPKAKDCGTYAVGYAVTLPDNKTKKSGTVTVTIVPKAVSDSMLALDEDLFEYDGDTHAPALTVEDGATELAEGVDYAVDASSATNGSAVGTYTISVTGMGAYTSGAAITWRIADTTDPVVTGVANGIEYSADVSFNVSDLLLESVTLQKDSGTPESLTVSGGEASGSASEDGVYTLTAEDTSGNVTTVTFTINVPAPVVIQAETPVFDPAGGTQFRGSLRVTIFCETPGAVIRYTMDGTDPDASSGTVYASGSAITLTRSATLKAIATADGYTDSEIASAVYTRRAGSSPQEEEIGDDGPPLASVFPFVDVPEDAYCRKAVEWALENGVTGGTTPTTFSPEQDATRAQTVTFLWAAAGAPEPETADSPFRDVAAADYYCKAVLWAYGNGITAGISADEFGAARPVTRGQFATFLWAAAGRPEPEKADDPFEDVAADAYYCKAVLWAYEKGITAGTGETTFSPDAACLREQIVTFLYLFY